jgi:hypothetical protein
MSQFFLFSYVLGKVSIGLVNTVGGCALDSSLYTCADTKVVSSTLEDFPQIHLGDRAPKDPHRKNNPREETRMCTSATTSSLLGMGTPTFDVDENTEGAHMEVEEGGKDPYILSGYRENEPGDCTLGETLDSLVPLLREVDVFVPLSTFQGKNFVTLPGSTELTGQSGNRFGGVGTSYAWSRGLGFETSPIKTRSTRKKATLSVDTPDPPTTTVTDSGALRGMKALARAKP